MEGAIYILKSDYIRDMVWQFVVPREVLLLLTVFTLVFHWSNML